MRPGARPEAVDAAREHLAAILGRAPCRRNGIRGAEVQPEYTNGSGGRITRHPRLTRAARPQGAARRLRRQRVLSRVPSHAVQDVRVSRRPWMAESDPLESNEGLILIPH